MNNFLTCYDPEGKVIIFGKQEIVRISRLIHYRNKIKSRKSKSNIKHKERYALTRAFLHLFTFKTPIKIDKFYPYEIIYYHLYYMDIYSYLAF